MLDILNYQITNNNGITYTIICQYGENAILLGGNDYVVITDLSNFRKLHTWGSGTYFPHFHDKDRMIKSFEQALNYFKQVSKYDGYYENEENY